MAAKLLLVEDDVLLSSMLTSILQEKGFSVCLCEDVQSAMEVGYEEHFDLYILDVKLPSGDVQKVDSSLESNGFTLLRYLREAGKTSPAIMLTSLAQASDVKEGFESGCDDYIRKPFDVEELLLRINSLLKRPFYHQDSPTIPLHNGTRFDCIQKTLFSPQGELIALTNKERELLALLVQKRGQFVSQDEIFERVWSYDESPTSMALRVYVKNLRKILGKESIITQRFCGYCYKA